MLQTIKRTLRVTMPEENGWIIKNIRDPMLKNQ